MLALFFSSKSFPYSDLAKIYRTSILQEGALRYPEEPEEIRIALAESDFLSYIRLDFFPRKGSLYALWQEGGRYVSAARIEPYRDGVLLSGLETAPEYRGRGYASSLLAALLDALEPRGIPKVYSHVGKGNRPSLAVHRKNGFRIFKDTAVYLDGSADSRAYTLLKNLEENENNA